MPLLNPVELPTAKAPGGSSAKSEAADSTATFSEALTTATSDATVRENASSEPQKTESSEEVTTTDTGTEVQDAALESDASSGQSDSTPTVDGTELPTDGQPVNNAVPDVVAVPIALAQVAAHEVPTGANAARVVADNRTAENIQVNNTAPQPVKVAEGVSAISQVPSTTPQPTVATSGDRVEAPAQQTPVDQVAAPRVSTSTDRPANSREQSGQSTETQSRPVPLQQRNGQSSADTTERDSSSPRDNRTGGLPSLPQIVSDEQSTPAVTRANEVNLAMRAMAAPDNGPLQPAPKTTSLPSSVPLVEVSGRVETNPAPQLAQVSRVGATVDVQPTETRPTDSAYRIVRGMQTMLNTRGGAMNMRLDPPELGTMRIVMSVNNGSVSATFEVQTTAAMNTLNQSMTALRHSLEQQGLMVERLNVHTAPQTQSESNQNHDRSNEEQDRSRFADAGQGESRGKQDESKSDDRTTDTTGTTKAKPVFTLMPTQ